MRGHMQPDSCYAEDKLLYAAKKRYSVNKHVVFRYGVSQDLVNMKLFLVISPLEYW